MLRPHLPSTVLALTLPGLSGGAEPGCFDAGLAALDAGRFAAAADAFEAAARRPACAGDAPDLRFNAGFALQRLAADGDIEATCRAVGAYREVVATTHDPDLARTARSRITALGADCPTRATTTRSWALRSAVAAGVTGIGTALVYGLALDADGDRATARDAYVAHRRAGRADDAEVARRRFEDARNSTDALAITAYVGLGLTLTLAGLAASGWLIGDGSSGVAIAPRGLGVEVSW